MRTGVDALRGLCGGARRASGVVLMLAACAGGAMAQGLDCGRLQAQIAAVGRGNPGQASRYVAAANRQQAEIERTAAYAASIGCNNRQFLFFGSSPPPQCGGLLARIQQMRANVAALQGQAQAASGEGQRRELQARFDASCRGGAPGGRGLFDALFGRNTDQRMQLPIEDMRETPRQERSEDDDDRPRGGSQAVCVRTCDGGFFPVSYTARRSNLDDLEELCKALCPNVEAALYTYSPSRDIDSAASTSGEPYSALKNAGKYRTKYDPTCTCKPPHKSWVEALADAESLLGRKRSTDIIVTPQKSEELLRARATQQDTRRKPGTPPPAAPPEDAQEPTTEPAPEAPAATAGVERNDPKRDDRGPAGGRKRVRVIAPNL